MPRMLQIAPNLRMPLDAVTHTFGIFGQKGSGKSSTAAVFVEQGVAAGGRFVIADPTGVWWGLMHDGDRPGAAGDRVRRRARRRAAGADGGHVVAEFVVQQDEYPVVVLDMKLMRKADRTRFMLDVPGDALPRQPRGAPRRARRVAPVRADAGPRGRRSDQAARRGRGRGRARPVARARDHDDLAAVRDAERERARADRHARRAPARRRARPEGAQGLDRGERRPGAREGSHGRDGEAQDGAGARVVAGVPRLLRRGGRERAADVRLARDAEGRPAREEAGQARAGRPRRAARADGATIEEADANDPKKLRWRTSCRRSARLRRSQSRYQR
jgi:hypothetical protein